MEKILLKNFSKMSGKLAGIPALNVSPFSDFCDNMSQNPEYICSKCYSRRMLSSFRKNCLPSFDKNGKLASHKRTQIAR